MRWFGVFFFWFGLVLFCFSCWRIFNLPQAVLSEVVVCFKGCRVVVGV